MVSFIQGFYYLFFNFDAPYLLTTPPLTRRLTNKQITLIASTVPERSRPQMAIIQFQLQRRLDSS